MNTSRNKFDKLLKSGYLDENTFQKIKLQSEETGRFIEDIFLEKKIPKGLLLQSYSEYFGHPFIEFSEAVNVPVKFFKKLNGDDLISELWFPLSVKDDCAEIVIYDPDDIELTDRIKKLLKVTNLRFKIALPWDIIRIIEHNYDINKCFPFYSGRTPLAKVRTLLAGQRSSLSLQRTEMAKARTGLSLLRSGIAFITISLSLIRAFDELYLLVFEIPLLLLGVIAVIDGLIWYIPGRKDASKNFDYIDVPDPGGFTILGCKIEKDSPIYFRSQPVANAEIMREKWSSLTPLERRRFLANDRTDMAEERTKLASLRTRIAKTATGLAFTRSGISFTGLGIGLLRYTLYSYWSIFDLLLILAGVVMTFEGFYWFIPGYRAGTKGITEFKKALSRETIWDNAFPPFYKSKASLPIVRAGHAPGIWGTTGLALERTVLAERRNLMARLRTVMAWSRLNLVFVRTGLSVISVGTGLLLFFGLGNVSWTVINFLLILTGFFLILDGIRWYLPGEKIKKQFPYCFGDFEITLPDYTIPVYNWKKVIFSNDNI